MTEDSESSPDKQSPNASVPGKRKLPRHKQIAFLGILLGAMLIGQEIVLRIIFPIPEVSNLNRVRYSQMFHSTSGKIGQGTFLANASYTHASEPDGQEFVHTLNLYGFRDRQWSLEKPAGHRRVMFFGDSFVEGAMAPDGYTIPDGFRAAAEAGGQQVDVMNLGVQAMSLDGYVHTMADTVPLFKPDTVVLVFFENDFYSPPLFNPALLNGTGVEPKFNSPWTPRIMKLIRNLKTGQPNPRRWISPPFSFFAQVPNPRNPLSERAPFEFYQQFTDKGVFDAMVRGRFNPFLLDGYLADENELKKPVNIASYLMVYKGFLEKHGCELFTAYIPINHQVSDHYLPNSLKFSQAKEVKSLMAPEYNIHRETVSSQCAALKIPFLDFTPLLRKMETKGQRLYWEYDNHMRGESYLFLGDQIYEWINSRWNAKK
jgi:hypothetical protein